MDITFLTGIIGSLTLVTGAAWPETKNDVIAPYKSVKDWMFAVGGVLMLLYSVLGYVLHAAPVFFVILEVLIVIASVLMMCNTPDKVDSWVLGIGGALMVAWSLMLFEGYTTVIFIIGLLGIGLGYAFQGGTVRRDLALTLGSAIIAVFSYLEASWIFFWLNSFFAIFSAYYLVKNIQHLKKS